MLIDYKQTNLLNFNVEINNFILKKTNYVKYIGVMLDDKQSWKNHIVKPCQKLLRLCRLMFKLRHFVLLSTRKAICYSLFHSVLSCSLIHCERIAKHTVETQGFPLERLRNYSVI